MATEEDNYRQRLKDDPDDLDAQLRLGLLLQSLDRLDEAKLCFEHCVERRPAMLAALFSLATVQHAMGQFDSAIERFNAVINAALSGVVETSARNLAATYNNLGNVYRDIGRFEDAESCYRQAISYDPQFVKALYSLGFSLFSRSEIEEATMAGRQAIALDPGFIEAHYLLSKCETRTERDEGVTFLEKLWDDGNLSNEQKSLLAFTLGTISDQLGEPARAFRYWEAGNQLLCKLRPYDCASTLRRLSSTKKTFSADSLKSVASEPDTGLVPVFVVGMPRSGSSLVEQILASHSMVHGAGELELLNKLITGSVPGYPDNISGFSREDWRRLGRRYLDKLNDVSAGKTWVVDKGLINYQHIGALRLMLPNARIIHCMRDPLDICLSCFQHKFKDDGLGFSNSLRDLARVYGGYSRLLAHWNAILPGWIYENSYEQLVSQPEQSIRELLSFCGLPFEEVCLNFHKTRRLVNTASAGQVQRPIYSTSKKRWMKYRQELGGLIAMLDEEGVLKKGTLPFSGVMP